MNGNDGQIVMWWYYKEVRKIFRELNIYTFVTYCYNKKRGFFNNLFVYYNMIKREYKWK